MYSIRQIYKSMYEAINGICDKIYIQDRPQSIDKRIDSYMLLEINSSITNEEQNPDGEYNMFSGIVRFVLFLRNRTSANNFNAVNIDTLEEKFKLLMSKFPVSDDFVFITRPYVLMSGNDGSDFHYVAVNASIKTK